MDPTAIAQELADRLGAAWNAADGQAYGEPFAADAGFVAIRGDLHSGREAIARGHEGILGTIYAGSTIRYEVVDARALRDDVLIAHVRGTLNAPSGPLAGEQEAMATAVVVREGEEWRIAAFHNTLVSA
ncbi:MAG: SgcJ/EcaC family oxidoreductase [Actinomycetota bacterium]|nr:SgcJ/EcaC family oxidoreductase [Actinomycetota bacterium]